MSEKKKASRTTNVHSTSTDSHNSVNPRLPLNALNPHALNSRNGVSRPLEVVSPIKTRLRSSTQNQYPFSPSHPISTSPVSSPSIPSSTLYPAHLQQHHSELNITGPPPSLIPLPIPLTHTDRYNHENKIIRHNLNQNKTTKNNHLQNQVLDPHSRPLFSQFPPLHHHVTDTHSATTVTIIQPTHATVSTLTSINHTNNNNNNNNNNNPNTDSNTNPGTLKRTLRKRKKDDIEQLVYKTNAITFDSQSQSQSQNLDENQHYDINNVQLLLSGSPNNNNSMFHYHGDENYSSAIDTTSLLPEMDENEEHIMVDEYEGRPECGICFDKIKDQGLLDCCTHTFCVNCIMQWSNVTNLCPLCKKRFSTITKKQNEGSSPKKRRPVKIKVVKKDQIFIPNENEEDEENRWVRGMDNIQDVLDTIDDYAVDVELDHHNSAKMNSNRNGTPLSNRALPVIDDIEHSDETMDIKTTPRQTRQQTRLQQMQHHKRRTTLTFLNSNPQQPQPPPQNSSTIPVTHHLNSNPNLSNIVGSNNNNNNRILPPRTDRIRTRSVSLLESRGSPPPSVSTSSSTPGSQSTPLSRSSPFNFNFTQQSSPNLSASSEHNTINVFQTNSRTPTIPIVSSHSTNATSSPNTRRLKSRSSPPMASNHRRANNTNTNSNNNNNNNSHHHQYRHTALQFTSSNSNNHHHTREHERTSGRHTPVPMNTFMEDIED
jgi:hypothetical protein